MNFRPWRKTAREPKPTDEACEAIRQADRALLDADRRDDAIRAAEETARRIRLRNHFREAVEDTMRRKAT